MQGRLEVPPGVLELTPQLAEVLLSHEHILVWLFFFFLFSNVLTCGLWKFPSQGVNLSQSCDLM